MNHIELTTLFDYWAAALPWTEVVVLAGTTPPPRMHATAVATSNHMFLFGGDANGDTLDDTWIHPEFWRRPPRPPEQTQIAMVRHDAAAHILVFGGRDNSVDGTLPDTYILTRKGWVDYPGTSPGARIRPFMGYDPIAQHIVMFGGTTPNEVPLFETWIWDGTNWLQRQAAQAPPFATTMAFDGKHLTMLGRETPASPTVPQTWSWDGATWFKASPVHSPSARMNACVGYDPVRKQLVLFGGTAGVVPFGDTWTYDGVDWTEHVVDSSPLGRTDAPLTWNPARQRLVLGGGSGSFDSWEWNGTAWSPVGTATSPSVRSGFGAATALGDAGTLVFAGETPSLNGTNYLNDLWELRWDEVIE